MMPRIDVGGSSSGTQIGFTAYGTGGQRVYFEGINGTEGTSTNGNYVDMFAYDEVAVNTAGNNAEMGIVARGVHGGQQCRDGPARGDDGVRRQVGRQHVSRLGRHQL